MVKKSTVNIYKLNINIMLFYVQIIPLGSKLFQKYTDEKLRT